MGYFWVWNLNSDQKLELCVQGSGGKVIWLEPKDTNVRREEPDWRDLWKLDFVKIGANHKCYIISTSEHENILVIWNVWQFKGSVVAELPEKDG